MIYRFGTCTYDTERHELFRDSHKVPVERQVREVLVYFLQHRHRVLSRDELLEQCWAETYISDAAVNSCLSRLRQAIGQRRGGPLFIQTVHGAGYRFVAEVLEAEALPVPPIDLPQPPIPAAEPVPVALDPVALDPVALPSAPEAERRQLTVLSCALVNLDALSAHLDAERLHQLMQQFRACTLESIERFEGYVAQYGMASLLVYYGYPQAHEDDARRAVGSALSVVEQLVQLEAAFEGLPASGLSVRVGIHTGVAIVEEVSPALPSAVPVVVGAVPNVAVQIQERGRGGSVVISEATRRLVQDRFVCKELEQELRVGEEVFGLYEVQAIRELGSDGQRVSRPGQARFVGRESELGLLQERWEQTCEGQGQVVLVRGEAGIGKTRLVQEMKARVLASPHVRVECLCSPYHQHTAFYPLVEALQRALQAEMSTSAAEPVAVLEAILRRFDSPVSALVPLLSELLGLSVPEGYGPVPETPQGRRQGLLDGLLRMTLGQAQEEPLLFIVEDLHWADASTLEWLDLLIEQAPSAALLVVLTCRPAFELPWELRTPVTPITLRRLTQVQVETLVGHLTGDQELPPSRLVEIVDKSDGVPLFAEELTRTVLEAERLDARGKAEGYGSAPVPIPSTLQDLLMSRLDRQGAAKEVAHWGAVIGREFNYPLLAAVVPGEEALLQEGLQHLVQSELLIQRGIQAQTRHYRFKHALLQEAASNVLLTRRRQAMHRRVAEVLEEQFAEWVELQPEVLAYHYTEAGLAEQAIPYWQRAGQQAVQRSAVQEAMQHLNTGLALLATLPETPAHAQQELALCMALGPVLMGTRGLASAEVEQTYARAWALCQQLRETPQRFVVLSGLWRLYQNGGRLATAREIAEQLLTLAQHQSDVTCRMAAHTSLGYTLAYMGEFSAARPHLEQEIALTDPETQRTLALRYGAAPGVQCLSYAAIVLWCLGYPDQALAWSQASCTLARELRHPLSQVTARYFAARLYQMRREAQAARDQAEILIALSTEYTLPPYLALGRFALGWALVAQGQREEGVTLLRQGATDVRAKGSRLSHTTCLHILAEAFVTLKQIEAGLHTVTEALDLAEQTGVRLYEAETYRIKGALLLHQADPDATQVEACFQQALDIARRQAAKSFELRATTSLARLWKSQGRCQEAYDLLAPVYRWFTEGFDTADLQDARALLAQLA
jgi:predicted ATPase/DNA-binding winged helix-turn-helix (wHTH) protein/class 3 adenylate cyclase